jgi:hypothetical protein
MSARQQSKRAAFARLAKRSRRAHAIMRRALRVDDFIGEFAAVWERLGRSTTQATEAMQRFSLAARQFRERFMLEVRNGESFRIGEEFIDPKRVIVQNGDYYDVGPAR